MKITKNQMNELRQIIREEVENLNNPTSPGAKAILEIVDKVKTGEGNPMNLNLGNVSKDMLKQSVGPTWAAVIMGLNVVTESEDID